MLKKNTIAAAVISIILSIFAFIFNIFAFYLFLVVGAFVSLGASESAFIIDVVLILVGALVIFAVILFAISIGVANKTKKAEEFTATKKLLITFIIFAVLVALINLIIGILVIESVIGWFYILFALIYALSAGLIISDLIKNSKMTGNDKIVE